MTYGILEFISLPGIESSERIHFPLLAADRVPLPGIDIPAIAEVEGHFHLNHMILLLCYSSRNQQQQENRKKKNIQKFISRDKLC